MKKRAITSVCGLVLILAVLLTFVCVFTIYRDPINEAVLNTLNDIGIDGTHLSAAPESASVAEAAGSLSVSGTGKRSFPSGAWTAQDKLEGPYKWTTGALWWEEDHEGYYGYKSGDGGTCNGDKLKNGFLYVDATANKGACDNTFTGSFTVKLSGKALNYAKSGLLNCSFGFNQYWSAGGTNQNYTFSIPNSDNLSITTAENGNGVVSTGSISLKAASISNNSFTVNLSAGMKATESNIACAHNFWINISFDEDKTKPTASIAADQTNGYSTVDPGNTYFKASKLSVLRLPKRQPKISATIPSVHLTRSKTFSAFPITAIISAHILSA